MHKLDLTISRLKLLLAEINGKREALAATRYQYQEQVTRLVRFAVHDDGGVDRTLAMMMDVDARLQELSRQEQYLNTIRDAAQRELDSLQLTKLVEEARAQLTVLRARQEVQAADPDNAASDPAWIDNEIRRLEEVIAQASGAAAKSISSR
jgi:hypothetical protein